MHSSWKSHWLHWDTRRYCKYPSMQSTLNLQQCTHRVNIRLLCKFLPKSGFPVCVNHFCSVSSHIDRCREGRGWERFACIPVWTISVCAVFKKLQCWIQLEMTAILSYHYCVLSGSSAVGYRLLLKPDVQELFTRNISVIEWKRILRVNFKTDAGGAVSSWFYVPLRARFLMLNSLT